jgi:katanin p60 ATPase-containing subunit A1
MASSSSADIALPDANTLAEMFRFNLREVELTADVDFSELALLASGYSGADVANICRDAALMPMRRHIKGMKADQIKSLKQEDILLPICMDDVRGALKKVSPSVGRGDLEQFEKWREEYGAV